MKTWMIGATAAAALAGIGAATVPAAAVPAANLAEVAADAQSHVQNVRWVCGPYRCWWRPGRYYAWRHAYGFYRPYWHHRRHWGWRHRHWW